jgi:mRNA interferase MazF
VKRGDIWWASMEEPRGSEPGYRRPVVIVSSNDFNKSLIQTVICAVISSNLNLEAAPGNFKIKRSKECIGRDSVVNISQLITLDKSYLTEQSGRLSSKQINELNDGLKLALSL